MAATIDVYANPAALPASPPANTLALTLAENNGHSVLTLHAYQGGSWKRVAQSA